MKKIICLILFLGLFFLKAQIFNPITWEVSIKEISKKETIYEIQISIALEKKWHLYPLLHKGSIGTPTSIEIKGNEKNYIKIGELKEIVQLKTKEEQGKKIFVFYNKGLYKQKIKYVGKKPFEHQLIITTQPCNDSLCLAPNEKIFYAGINTSGKAYIKEHSLDHSIEKLAEENKLTSFSNTSNPIDKIEDSTKENIEDKNLYDIFLLGLLGGFAALLMPCIIPMIPITIGYFTKEKKVNLKKVLFYGLSIIIIYLGISLLFSLIFGLSFLYELSTNPWANLIFFFIFIWFAFSFFGLFNINLPSFWLGKIDKGAEKKGFLGIFFMAFILTLVSFSCTAPIIGSLLVQSVLKKAIMAPIIGMFGFSLGLSIPFMLFAFFPKGLKLFSLSSKTGELIKISFGFIELALAMKFLSNADMIWQLKWLEREVFLSFWIVLFLLLSLYLLGLLPLLNKDEKKENKLNIIRLLFAIFPLSFSLYMLPGLWGAPLKIISGLIPPIHYSQLNSSYPFSSLSNPSIEKQKEDIENMAFKSENGIYIFNDLKEGLNYAKRHKKPILLNFSGYTCANCRKMEELVWSDPMIKNFLNDQLVIISLYVDNRNLLKKGKSYFSTILNKEIKTIGNQWMEFQIHHFKSNAQPLYIIVNHDIKKMNHPIGAEFNKNNYLMWLKKGVDYFYKPDKI